MCTGIVVFLGCEVVNFENNLFFLIELFFYMNKNSRQKSEYLENEESYLDAIKSIFHEQRENSASFKKILHPSRKLSKHVAGYSSKIAFNH